MPTTSFDKESIKQSIIGKLQRYNGRTVAEATPQQIYKAVASTVRDQIMQKWMIAREERKRSHAKRLYYLSVEFLMGRSLYNNMLNLVSTDVYTEALKELGINLQDILVEEPEPGLGNGGLGRLAACFLDSLSTLQLPAMGCTIRYEYGLFRQKIVDGSAGGAARQLAGQRQRVGNARAGSDACEVHFGGHVDEVRGERRAEVHLEGLHAPCEAVPYDMPIVGYDTAMVNMSAHVVRPQSSSAST